MRWSNSEVQSRQWKIPIINVETMKTIDGRERCMLVTHTWYVVMRWSNIEV